MNLEKIITLPEYVTEKKFMEYIFNLYTCGSSSGLISHPDENVTQWVYMLYKLSKNFDMWLGPDSFYYSMRDFYKKIVRIYSVSFSPINLPATHKEEIVCDLEGLGHLPNTFIDYKPLIKKYYFEILQPIHTKEYYLFVVKY